MAVPRTIISTHEIPNPITHPTGIFLRVTIEEMWSVIDAKVCPGSTVGCGEHGTRGRVMQ